MFFSQYIDQLDTLGLRTYNLMLKKKMAEMITLNSLPIEFVGRGEVRGFFFTQVRATEKGFIYSVMNEGKVWYEVFRRKINQFGGVSYPRSKSFGKWAWSYFSLDKALNKLESL